MNDSYIAGFFDGDGCVSIEKKGRHINLVIGQRDREVLDCIQQYLGYGTIRFYKGKTDYHLLYISSMDKIIEFSNRILPYSIVKRRQLELAIEFCKTKRVGNQALSVEVKQKRSLIYKEVRKLNSGKDG